MFKIEYAYKKGGPLYECRYPLIKDEEHNIFILKGKNDRGKSTSLQMVALGLYGQELEDIDSILKERMNRLVDENVEKCDFDFVIANKDSLKIEVKFYGGKSKVFVNGSLKNQTYIKDRFKIIFETPKEPLKKLSSALESVESVLKDYENYIALYLTRANAKISEIESYENKNKNINQIRLYIKDKNESLNNLKKRLEDLKRTFNKLEKAKTVHNYESWWNEIKVRQAQIKNLDKNEKHIKSKGAGGGDNQYKKLREEFYAALQNLKLSITNSVKLTTLIHDKQKRSLESNFSALQSIDSIHGLDDQKFKEWYDFFDKIRVDLEGRPIFRLKSDEEKQLSLLEKLSEILKDYIDMTAAVPGTSGKNVADFLKEIEEKEDEIRRDLSEKLSLMRAVNECSTITRMLGELAVISAKFPKGKFKDSDIDEIKLKIKSLKEEESEFAKRIAMIETEYKNIPHYERIELSQEDPEYAEKEYQNIKRQKEELELIIKNLNIDLEGKGQLFKSLSSSKKPESSQNKSSLVSKYTIASDLGRKLAQWIELIKRVSLEKNKLKGEDLNQSDKKFYDAIGEYFAGIISTVYFENKGWKVNKIDLIERKYIVEKRNPISFIDIGTGHTALNALMAKLKQNYGDKKKILLFDEIGDMDEENINRLLGEIKLQVNRGEVLLALLTQADNSKNEVVMDPVF